jgi:vacuolar-type H+-ATPase subunit H
VVDPGAKNIRQIPEWSEAQLQSASSVLSEMESRLDGLKSRVGEMKKRLQDYAVTEAGRAKSEILDQLGNEAEVDLETTGVHANKEAEQIILKAEADIERLTKNASANMPQAVDLIARTVRSV